MNYSVSNWDDMLRIVDAEEHPVYYLDVETLQRVSLVDNANCSACIFHLASYGVLPTSVLYQIAAHIQTYFPALHIDWFTTFYYVEKVSYTNMAFRMKEMLEEKEACYEDDRLSRFIAFEENDPVEHSDAIILKIVMMNIINFGIRIR